MTDSNINNLLNNEEEEEKKKIETPETDALFQRFDNQPLSSVSKAINKSQAGVVDFFDNKFLGCWLTMLLGKIRATLKPPSE